MMKTWIFQANPVVFDVDGYIAASQDILWSVRQAHLAQHMEFGDRVFLWRAAGKSKSETAGIIASGVLTGQPALRIDEPNAAAFWRGVVTGEPTLRVPLTLERQTEGRKRLIKRSGLQGDPILKDLRILHMANQTNFLVDESSAVRLKSLWLRIGQDWDRKDSVAGLWSYAKTDGGSPSATFEADVSRIAILIGRDVTAVHYKIANFRSLDPRGQRAGFSNVAEIDRQVWQDFFDPIAQGLRLDALENEFRKLWGNLYEPSQDSDVADEKSNQSKQQKGRSRSQGYQANPAARRAVELRAMDVAKTAYEKRGYKVTDTSATKPYDLSCTKDANEVRVEVKGSTASPARVIVTANEVTHAQDSSRNVDLFIVSDIEVLRSPEGPQAIGGVSRRIDGWQPIEQDLEPASFYFRLPEP